MEIIFLAKDIVILHVDLIYTFYMYVMLENTYFKDSQPIVHIKLGWAQKSAFWTNLPHSFHASLVSDTKRPCCLVSGKLLMPE